MPEPLVSKAKILGTFREAVQEVMDGNQDRNAADAAKKVNKAVRDAEALFRAKVERRAAKEGWAQETKAQVALLTRYCGCVVLIEGRNAVRPYEYMDFSRRVGELWERFCRAAFDFSVRPLDPYDPPNYSDLKTQRVGAFRRHLEDLEIPQRARQGLMDLYEEVWRMAHASRVNLTSDLHVIDGDTKHVIDLKSGFGSNEKGNTNRLLLVGSIYNELRDGYACTLLVRAEEDQNNNYFRKIQKSGIWEAHCGAAAYDWIGEVTGIDLAQWVRENVDWTSDLDGDTVDYLTERALTKYLAW